MSRAVCTNVYVFATAVCMLFVKERMWMEEEEKENEKAIEMKTKRRECYGESEVESNVLVFVVAAPNEY